MIFRGRSLQYFVFCAVTFNVLLCGLHFGWPSPFLPQLLADNSTISMTNDEGSWVASMFLIGGIFGSLLAAAIFDVIGRKKLLLLTSIPFLPAWLMIAFAHTTVELILARFIAGISDGLAYCSIPLYLAEIADAKIRGFLISGIAVVYFIGTFLINLLGSYFNIQTTALICSGLSVLSTLLCLLVPETPHFYMMKGDVANAKIITKQLHENADVDKSLNLIKEALDEQKRVKGKWLQLFTDASNRKSFFMVVVLVLVQQFNGIVGIMFYVQTLFEKAVEGINPIGFISIYFVLQILTAIVNAATIDKIGRRKLLLVSIVMVIIALCLVSTYFTLQEFSQIDLTDYYWFPIAGFFLFVVGYTIGLHNVPILLGGEIFPLHVKAFAVCLLDIFYGLSSTVVSKFFQYTKDEFGIHVPFIAFSIFTLCGLPFIIFCVPETKNKTLEEIQSHLRSKRPSK